MTRRLDFICIGAPKSATSTLFELIEGHPEIYIPPSKEAPFFNNDSEYKKGWDWYMKTFFKYNAGNKKLGTITPQYMSGFGHNTSEVIAERIHKQLPDAKIIAILRNPIDRAYSQHKMHLRFGNVKNDFGNSVRRALSANYTDSHSYINYDNMFILASEYGRILNAYYKYFGRKNLLVLFTDEFESNPEDTIVKIFQFLNIGTDYRPDNIRRRSHVGGGKAKIKYLTPAYLQSIKPLNYLWMRIVPVSFRKKVFMWLTRWNIKPDNKSLNKKSKEYKDLAKYFSKDIKILESLIERKVPWKDWK